MMVIRLYVFVVESDLCLCVWMIGLFGVMFGWGGCWCYLI